MAQDFFAAFGHDGVGRIGTETTINSGDMAGILMIAVPALANRTAELKQKEERIAVLESRLEALDLRKNPSIQITADEPLGVCGKIRSGFRLPPWSQINRINRNKKT